MINELNVASSVLTQLQCSTRKKIKIKIKNKKLVCPNYDYDFNYLSYKIFPNKNN
jgi:hypothetical protein